MVELSFKRNEDEMWQQLKLELQPALKFNKTKRYFFNEFIYMFWDLIG